MSRPDRVEFAVAGGAEAIFMRNASDTQRVPKPFLRLKGVELPVAWSTRQVKDSIKLYRFHIKRLQSPTVGPNRSSEDSRFNEPSAERDSVPGRGAPLSGGRVVTVAISSSLLGAEARFDGGHARDDYPAGPLSRYCEWVPLCLEAAIGLGTPRECGREVAGRHYLSP